MSLFGFRCPNARGSDGFHGYRAQSAGAPSSSTALGDKFVSVDTALPRGDRPRHWQKKLEHNPAQHSPLTLARALYPAAPLCKCDDGKAVALLLARLALDDHRAGIDRNQIKAQALEKKKLKKRAARALAATQPQAFII